MLDPQFFCRIPLKKEEIVGSSIAADHFEWFEGIEYTFEAFQFFQMLHVFLRCIARKESKKDRAGATDQ